MKILITGSSGQIGTNLALRLLKDKHIVCGIDIRPNPWTAAFPTQLLDLSIITITGVRLIILNTRQIWI